MDIPRRRRRACLMPTCRPWTRSSLLSSRVPMGTRTWTLRGSQPFCIRLASQVALTDSSSLPAQQILPLAAIAKPLSCHSMAREASRAASGSLTQPDALSKWVPCAELSQQGQLESASLQPLLPRHAAPLFRGTAHQWDPARQHRPRQTHPSRLSRGMPMVAASSHSPPSTRRRL